MRVGRALQYAVNLCLCRIYIRRTASNLLSSFRTSVTAERWPSSISGVLFCHDMVFILISYPIIA